MPDAGIHSVTVPGAGGWLGQSASAFWNIAVEDSVYAGDLLSGEGLFRT